ncbi:MAG: PA2779 family protein, partial [Desulfobacteraceae bacterium]
MELVRKLSKPIAIFLSFYMLMLACPYQSAWAAMIGTEAITDADRNQSSRDYLKSLLAREDIKAVLIFQGIDPQEALARIDGLSDAEVNDIV